MSETGSAFVEPPYPGCLKRDGTVCTVAEYTARLRREIATNERLIREAERNIRDATPAGVCSLCGKPMPEGEEMFMFHGYSGPCPTPVETPEGTA